MSLACVEFFSPCCRCRAYYRLQAGRIFPILFMLAVMMLIVLLMLGNDGASFLTALQIPNYKLHRESQPVRMLGKSKPTNRTPLILFWNSIYDPASARALPPEFSSEHLKCSTDDLPAGQLCQFTHKRDQLEKADFVSIQYRRWAYDLPPPSYKRPPGQIWIFHIWESPAHTYDWYWITNLKARNQLAEMKGFFNWTMTYRPDSTVHYPYGRFRRRVKPDLSRLYDRLANKSRIAFWMASSCHTVSHRELYIKELEKAGLGVEIIGKCEGTKSILLKQSSSVCTRTTYYSTSPECSELIGSTYKFYLAFENSLCKDYITEKFFRAVSIDLIPVVLNGVNMSQIAPPHSYIDTRDFKSPKQLADYLKKVGSDSKLYNSYFDWKAHYDVDIRFEAMAFTKNICKLCSAAHEHFADPKGQIYEDIEDWWMNGGKCYEGQQQWPQ